MWNRRREDEYAPPPPAANSITPRPAEMPRETLPVAAVPVRAPEPEPSRGGSAVIGKSVHIKGQVISREDLYIDGEIEGTIEMLESRLTIGPNGKVQASVKARDLVVLGAIQGNVDAAEKVEIRKEARLLGDIKTARIVIEDGAYFKGSIDIARPERKPVPPPAASAPAPNPAPAPAMAAPAPAPAPAAAASVASSPAGAEVKR